MKDPMYIFQISVWKDLESDATNYYVRAYNGNDAISKISIPNLPEVGIGVYRICSTLDIIH